MRSYLDTKKRLENNLKNSRINLRNTINKRRSKEDCRACYKKELYHGYKLERFKGNKEFKGMSNQDLYKKAEIWSRYQGHRDYSRMAEKYKNLK